MTSLLSQPPLKKSLIVLGNSTHQYCNASKPMLLATWAPLSIGPPIPTTPSKMKLQSRYFFQRKLVRLPQPPRLEGMWKTKELDYCAYHRMLDHPTASCLVLKDQLQYFVNNHTIRLRPSQRA